AADSTGTEHGDHAHRLTEPPFTSCLGAYRYGSRPMTATITPQTEVDVAPVRGFADLRAFVDLPFRLHAGTPWVPPLRLERYLFLNRKINAYFKHGEAEYFLARRDGRVVGRVTAQIDRAFNDYHQSRWGMF